MAERTVSFDEILAMALRLSPLEKLRLMERVASTLEQDISAQIRPESAHQPDLAPT